MTYSKRNTHYRHSKDALWLEGVGMLAFSLVALCYLPLFEFRKRDSTCLPLALAEQAPDKRKALLESRQLLFARSLQSMSYIIAAFKEYHYFYRELQPKLINNETTNPFFPPALPSTHSGICTSFCVAASLQYPIPGFRLARGRY